ncbi:AraC family transcriptional regulator [Chryseobacterium indologenes]|uniref:AraC family transcriptional regulator n=2 Tax=Chryseobacterium indologenes TaxID=253 RepID=UPI000B51B152|nr:AraC family transcriptional regulator [Chryseobacterium indologenes]ASE60254.1 AraC family transcriptional regulator [Chryseobacterium indologenes]
MEDLKHHFIHQYVILTCCFLLLNIFIYQFFMSGSFLVLYFSMALLILSYTYLLIRKKYNANKIMHIYMIIGPLYISYILVAFWGTSVGSFVMLLPLPLAAYIFFSKKEAMAYSFYLLLIVIACFLVHKYSGFTFERFPADKIMITDILLFCYNLLVIAGLLVYNKKLNRLAFLSDIQALKISADKEERKKIRISEKAGDKENIDEEIVDKLTHVMETEMLFKNPNLNIAGLSSRFHVNYTYISKIIRYLGYTNFNHYLNVYRIRHVKMLIGESDLQKVTLMHIYTEAGFSNQATFNRVFKQMEGITPSEYISLTKEEKTELN